MMEKHAQHPDTQWKKAHYTFSGSLQAASANKIRYQHAQLGKSESLHLIGCFIQEGFLVGGFEGF